MALHQECSFAVSFDLSTIAFPFKSHHHGSLSDPLLVFHSWFPFAYACFSGVVQPLCKAQQALGCRNSHIKCQPRAGLADHRDIGPALDSFSTGPNHFVETISTGVTRCRLEAVMGRIRGNIWYWYHEANPNGSKSRIYLQLPSESGTVEGNSCLAGSFFLEPAEQFRRSSPLADPRQGTFRGNQGHLLGSLSVSLFWGEIKAPVN